MNIWVIGRSYPLMINNMQGSFEHEQAKMLSKHGNSVAYLACVFHPFKKVKKWGFCNWKEDNLHVFTNSQLYVHERMKLHLEPFKAAVWKKFLDKVEKDTGTPDIIHVHYPANITVARLIFDFQKKGTKIICTEHWTQVLKQTIDSYERKQLKQYADGADAFICVGKPLKEAVIKLTSTQKQIHIIPNIVNSAFEMKRIQQKEEYRFIAVGAVIPHKQFDKVILAFEKVFKGKKDVKLTIVGNGIEFKHLKRIVAEKNLENQVTLTGELNRHETAKYVANSNALICYSSCETFGVPLIEGWACGIPVIATTAVAVVDNWDTRLGVEVSPERIETLEEAMLTVYMNRDSYDRVYISNFSMEHFSEDAVYQKLAELYKG